jgi:hypothetical protein
MYPLVCQSQHFISKNRNEIILQLKKQYIDNKESIISFSDSDTLLKMTVITPGQKNILFSFGFNNVGNCNVEKVTAYSDTSFTFYLNKVLLQQKFKWKKINENQYVSSFSKALMIELPADEKEFSFSILKTSFSKKLYKFLLQKK